jgi:hypothetical protein
MSRVHLEPLTAISTVVPAGIRDLVPEDATGKVATGVITDKQKTDMRSGLHDLLHDLHCHCNGERLAIDSVDTTIRQRIKALAVTRRVDVGVREIAAERGVDLATASHSLIIATVTPEEINSLIAYESLISQETIDAVVTNNEMATIQTEETNKHRGIRDPEWSKDLTSLVDRAVPRHLAVFIPADPPIEDEPNAGVWGVVTVSVDLTSIKADVDAEGEIMAWSYNEG